MGYSPEIKIFHFIILFISLVSRLPFFYGTANAIRKLKVDPFVKVLQCD